MKIHPCRLLVVSVLGILVTTALPAASVDPTARAFSISAVERFNQPIVEPGIPEFTVRRVLGEPRRKLDAHTWLYDRFTACDQKIDTGDCATLVVTFTHGKVADLKLVNDRAEKVIAASLAKKENLPLVAAK